MKNIVRRLYVLLVFYSLNSSSQELFVATNGLDTNPGTQSQPFLTIQKAQQVARTLIPTMSQDVIVTIKDGVYFTNQSFVFNSSDSGKNGKRVIYRAQNSGRVEINGGEYISGWQVHDSGNSIYKTQLTPNLNIRTLFVNKNRAQRARSIDGSGWTVDVTNKRYNCPPEIQFWSENSDIEVAIRFEWQHHRIPIERIQGSIATIDDAFFAINRAAPFPTSSPAFIENAYELLDLPGEWYYSKTSGVLYYKPLPDEDIFTSSVLLPRTEQLLQINGSSDIVFEGVSFVGTTRLSTNFQGFHNAQGDVEYGRGSLQPAMVAAIYLENTTNTLFKSCGFKMLGTSALRMHQGCKNSVVFNSVFEDISGSAVSVAIPSYASIQEIASNQLVENIWVYNNQISKIGKEYEGCPAIMLGNGTRFYVVNNSIADVEYSGISIGWAWNINKIVSENSIIAYNRIDNVMKTLVDGGGIYTSSNMPGTFIRNNYLTNVINRWGTLYGDTGTANIGWNNNVVAGSIVNWMYLPSNNCYGNTVIGNYSSSPIKVLNCTDSPIYDNTVVANGEWPIGAKVIMNAAGVLSNAIGDNLTEKGNKGTIFWGKDPSSQSNDNRLWASFGEQVVVLDNLNGKTTLNIPIESAGTIIFHLSEWFVSNGIDWYKLDNPVITSNLIPSNNGTAGEIISSFGHVWGYNGTKWCQLDELIGTPSVFNLIAPVVVSIPEQFNIGVPNVTLSVNNGSWSGLTTNTVFSYQWYLNGVAIQGAIMNSYNPPFASTGNYLCLLTVSDGINSFSQSSNNFTIANQRPNIAISPVIENFAGVLKVTSTGVWQNLGSGKFSYQWKKNGVAIVNANQNTYVVPTVDYNNSFTCSISTTNNSGTTTVESNEIVLKFPLNDLTVNATAAYSTRKLSTNAQLALQVRRSSDNSTLDIGFDTFGNLNETALINFVGTGNGFVSRWYDQSGNNYHANQTNVLYQSKIVSDGVIIKKNNKPALFANEGRVFYNLNSVPSSVNYTAVAVFRKTEESKDVTIFSNSANAQLMRISSVFWACVYIGTTQSCGPDLSMANNSTVITYTRQVNGANTSITPFRNSIELRSMNSPGQPLISFNRLGAPWETNWSGWYSEAIWFNTNINTVDRLKLEGSQLKYFDIQY
jgi:hypothetical protein